MGTGNTAWPHLLEDIIAKRDALNQVIDTLTTHFIRDEPRELQERAVRRHAPRPGKKLAVKRTNERTNERTQGARQRAARSRPDVTEKQQEILTALRGKGSPSLGSFSGSMKFASTTSLMYHVKPLVKRGLVAVTGSTNDRRICLAGTRTAKEVP